MTRLEDFLSDSEYKFKEIILWVKVILASTYATIKFKEDSHYNYDHLILNN